MEWVRQLLWPRSSLYRFDIAPEARQLPFQVRDTSGRRKAALFAAMAACCAAIVVLAWWGIPAGRPPGLLIWLAVFGSGTAVFALLAVHKLLLRTRWCVGTDGVHSGRSYLFWQRNWHEPWSAYAGVVAEEQVSVKEASADPLLILLLKHRTNERRSVLLYASDSRKKAWEKQKHYAALFGLPALTDTGLGLETHSAEDVGKPLRQRLAEGSVEAPSGLPAQPSGTNLLATVNGSALTVTSRKGGSSRAAMVLAAVVGVVAIVLDIVVDLIWSYLTVILIGAVIVACAIAAANILMRLLKEELEISPEAVRKRWRHPLGVSWESVIQADEIEKISVRGSRKQKAHHTALWIVGGEHAIEFSAPLTVAEMNWVRECIIAVISAPERQ